MSRTNDRRHVGREPRWLSTEAAAQLLDTSPKALRQRVRRAARIENGQLIARLDLAVAKKFGKSWRFHVVEAVT